MLFRILIILSIAGVLLSGCSTVSKVYSSEEPGVNLYKYHTYNWLDNELASDGNKGPEWLTASTQNKVRTAVENQISNYGFKPCDDNPDLVLHYHVIIKNEVLYVHDWTCGADEGKFNRCNRVSPVQYREGTLIIDFIDAKTGEQVWRGAAVSVLNNMLPTDVEGRIQEAVKAIFKKFPEQPLPKA